MKENIIGVLLDILHWASCVDYIGYIGLTSYVGTQCGTIPIYSNSNEMILLFHLLDLHLRFMVGGTLLVLLII